MQSCRLGMQPSADEVWTDSRWHSRQAIATDLAEIVSYLRSRFVLRPSLYLTLGNWRPNAVRLVCRAVRLVCRADRRVPSGGIPVLCHAIALTTSRASRSELYDRS